MIQHLLPHATKAAPSFFNSMKIREALGEDGIA
jgi:hypothetical protein